MLYTKKFRSRFYLASGNKNEIARKSCAARLSGLFCIMKPSRRFVRGLARNNGSLLASAENLRQEYDRLLTWADLFDTCSFEAKKMIVAQFVKAVRVSRDYNIAINCIRRSAKSPRPAKLSSGSA